jgi:hypothetical protein
VGASISDLFWTEFWFLFAVSGWLARLGVGGLSIGGLGIRWFGVSRFGFWLFLGLFRRLGFLFLREKGIETKND